MRIEPGRLNAFAQTSARRYRAKQMPARTRSALRWLWPGNPSGARTTSVNDTNGTSARCVAHPIRSPRALVGVWHAGSIDRPDDHRRTDLVSSQAAPPTGYRPQLDGIRAVAVVMVILFHLGYGWVPGGFVGVDVFFVLSGYLITGLLAGEATSKGRVGLGRFYSRRVRRLLPASVCVLVAVMAIGHLVARPGAAAVARLGHHRRGALRRQLAIRAGGWRLLRPG